MALRVYADEAKTALLCDIGRVGRKCTLPTGANFAVEIVATNPPRGGYSAFRIVLQYSGSVNLIQQAGFDEFKAPKCNLGTEQKWLGLYFLSCKVVEPLSTQLSTYNGPLANVMLACKEGSGQIDLVGGTAFGSIYTQPGFVHPVTVPLQSQPRDGKLVADSVAINCSGQELLRLGAMDTDGDGCSNLREATLDEARGGRRDFKNPWDFYDVAGPGGGPPDGIVDLPNDILGVILHFAPGGNYPPGYEVYDRGPSVGPSSWNMSAPDGQIDVPNDILGVILQFNHDCR
jgi:hypothetical protein